MLHQPFENWILDPHEMSSQERQELRAHLENCPHCRTLAGQWRAAEYQLLQRVQVGPAPGFLQRWQARLAASKARNLLTVHRVAPALAIGLLIVAFALAVSYFSAHSMIDLLNSLSRAFIWISAQVQGILRTIGDWLGNPLAYLPLALIVFVALVIALVWLTALWRISRRGEVKEK